MASFKVIKLLGDFEKFSSKIQSYIENSIDWLPATNRTPNAVWSDVSHILGDDIKNQVSQSVGRPLHPVFWLTDYRSCSSLEIHRDNPGNEYPINSKFTVILMLRGHFEISIWKDDLLTLLEKVIVSPGELIVLNNSQYYHSGKVLKGVKLSLHAYPIIPEIDKEHDSVALFSVEDYV